jgi:hypothetical protein
MRYQSLSVLAVLGLSLLVVPAPAAPVPAARPLLAHWTLDEDAGLLCQDASGNGCDAAAEGQPAGLERVPGVFGMAMSFSGQHLLRAPGKPAFGELAQITVSAWVQPTAFERYNEIFRKEDGEQRVLFSFQETGTILSLGLNLGGYVECDAAIEPAQVLDGRWHYCVGTFDGSVMRVYLDGREIGQRECKGTIQAGGQAPGCIGSANGGECFQGLIDDVRILAAALSADEVAQAQAEGMKSLATLAELEPGGEPALELAPLAHWTFNERGPVPSARNSAADGHADIEAERPLPRVRGVHGKAAVLRGEPRLRVEGLAVQGLERFALSVWVRPTDLGGYREIFRQECPNRILFSFQGDGRILSLGLNVNGYEECDAAITPEQVNDGSWHHCAGTFDGQALRVYLDGREVGKLVRPGRLALQPDAPAFVGSSSGEGEFFQGGLDDLRIYPQEITQEQVTSIYQAGRDALDRHLKAIEASVGTVYVAGQSFAETLAATRRSLVEKGIVLDAEVMGALVARFRAAYAEESGRLQPWFGIGLAEYLRTPGNDINVRTVGRLVEMALEYKPLTDAQWARQPAAARSAWTEADDLARRLTELTAQGDAAQFSPEWITLAFAAGPRITFRPVVNEAVAPYVHPETPETRSLTADEARAVLERDWLHQADGKPTVERVRSEIGWARDLAARLGAATGKAPDVAAELAELAALEKQAEAPAVAAAELYLKVRQVKRRIAFRNPSVDFGKVLFVDMPYPQGSEWRHETRHRLGYMAVPGARLLTLDGLGPDGRLTQLMPQAPLHGSFWRPDLSWDGTTVLFCFKPHNEKSFHLYEIKTDGSGLTQLTEGPYDDFDPIYLPDGQHLLFSTTRAHSYVRCMPPTNAYVLARCDRDGRSIFLVSANNEPDYLPSVMNDGRVIYTRWEYTDKPLWRAQGLWTINPDGTQVNTFWGNQSVWPDLMKDARSIPGSRRVMFTGSAHHNWFAGSVGIVDPDRGYNFPDGVTKVTADMGWPECGNGPTDPLESPRYHASGGYGGYYSPYPLSEKDFLVSAERGGKFVLYLMDVDGNRELVYEGVHNILHAMPLKPRPLPPVLAERVTWPKPEDSQQPEAGVFYSGNVYQGAPAELRGKARFVRVLAIDAKTYTYWHRRPYLSTGPVVSAVQSEGVKRLLGTVPLEADGSLAFTAPPGKALHFQLLDEHGLALQTMRSFVGLMPGERRGCTGCHEAHSRAPVNPAPTQAVREAPRSITPPPWPDVTVSYPRYVQPVLDQYCGKCHQGEGKARTTLDLTVRPSAPIFPEPYHTLIGRPTWGQPYSAPEKPPPGFGIAGTIMVEAYSTLDPAAYVTLKPMTTLSYRSRLIQIASSGKHHEVKVDPVSLERLIVWVDAMCPYLGDEEVRAEDDPVFQGIDWLAVRPLVKTAPVIVRPGPIDVR